MRRLGKVLLVLTSLGLFGAVALGAAGIYALWHYGRDLPDYKQLADYEPPTATRIHAGDGRLIAEYATERRAFVPVRAMPRRVIEAFVAAEDQNFFTHPGVDLVALGRAVAQNVVNYVNDRRPIGASTITQQVAKNFLLTNEVSLERKLKEAILAFRIERVLSKERILELYLNEIYLGYGSYGVATAALNYFDKSLDELTTGEAAYLAALPKAPNNYHPMRARDAAVGRRNWVLGRMHEEGFIDAAMLEAEAASTLDVVPRSAIQTVEADYFVEEVRRELLSRYGESGLYQGGLSVRTTLNSALQKIARETLRQGLETYDRRHGWRGPVARLDIAGGWLGPLHGVMMPPAGLAWNLAVVIDLGDEAATIGLRGGGKGTVPMSEMRWARPWQEGQRVGPPVKRPSDVLAVGDVVLVDAVKGSADEKHGKDYPPGTYGLRQLPAIEGAIVALDPHTGRVLAMSGGYDFARNEFNRATQALRQPGSAFKPFVYLAALERGYTPATQILDAPFVLDQGPGLGKWKPANYSHRFYGPSPMRVGIEKSRNLMTVRLARAVGMDVVVDYAQRFNVVDQMPAQLAMALGAGETTLLRLTTAYGMLVNGGKRITPSLIDRVQDRNGVTVFRHDDRPCEECRNQRWNGQPPPLPPDRREQVVDAQSAYQVVTMLQGVVERGTGRRIRAVGKPLAGKTGTTNDERDAWFVGFSPDLVVGVYSGFDTPQRLGNQETGSSVAAPIFQAFMERALEDKPAIPFRIPAGIRLVRVNAETGRAAQPGDATIILEAFKATDGSGGNEMLIDGSDAVISSSADLPAESLGGKY